MVNGNDTHEHNASLAIINAYVVSLIELPIVLISLSKTKTIMVAKENENTNENTSENEYKTKFETKMGSTTMIDKLKLGCSLQPSTFLRL